MPQSRKFRPAAVTKLTSQRCGAASHCCRSCAAQHLHQDMDRCADQAARRTCNMPTGPDQGSAPRASPRRASGSRNPSFEALGYPKPETVVRRARARRLACGKTEPMDLRHCLERLSTEGQPPRKSTCRRTPSKELQSFRRQRAGVMSNQRLNARMKDRGSEYPSSSEISAISLVEYSSRLRARIVRVWSSNS